MATRIIVVFNEWLYPFLFFTTGYCTFNIRFLNSTCYFASVIIHSEISFGYLAT